VSDSTETGSLEEVLAQVAGEASAGLMDVVQLPMGDSCTHIHQEDDLMLADIAAAGDAAVVIGSFSEAPLQVVQQPDAALDAFDHMVLPPSAGSSDATASTAVDVADARVETLNSLLQENVVKGECSSGGLFGMLFLCVACLFQVIFIFFRSVLQSSHPETPGGHGAGSAASSRQGVPCG